MAAKKKPSKSFEFIQSYLKRKPTAKFADVKDAAAKKGYKIFPISYGRAKALLGLVKVAPRGQGGKKKRAGRGPGRPRKTATAGLDQLDMVIRAVKDNEAQAARYRKALEQISDILHQTL